MRKCLGCSADLVRRSQKLYCSVKCMQALRRRLAVQQWLETGIARADSHQDHYVRWHIDQEQGHRCAICAGIAEWNGAPLILVLDHVDGDASNNRRENLRLICPNCDSQLPTYKMRNKGNGRHARRQRYADGTSY
jgi:hypothetical protein